MKEIYLNENFSKDFPEGDLRIDGDKVYILNKVKVQRGIKGKTKSKVDEVLIVGMRYDIFKERYIRYEKEI